jgi:carnitine 3-dehydrogenase
MRGIGQVGVIGGGLIGSGWSALFAARGGHEVRVWDPSEDVRMEFHAKFKHCRTQLGRLGNDLGGQVSVVDSMDEAVFSADWIQENAPEKADLKRELFLRLERTAKRSAIIASSTSSFTWSQIFDHCETNERMIIAHPFNPPHLMPLVELFAPHKPTVAAGRRFFAEQGHFPVAMKQEAIGHIANRLASALWREAVHLVAAGIADVADIDAVLRHGPGLRWSVIGTHLGYHLGGGDGGLAHYLEHLGPSQEARWRSLGSPSLDKETCRKLVEGVAAEAKGRGIAELEALRDDELIGILRLRRRYPALLREVGE